MSRAPMPDSAMGDNPMPSSFDGDLEFWDEGRLAKLGRRLKEEPLIPLGLALTCYALYNAATSMRKGDKEATNRYFRARLYAQGFTIVCICAGAIYWKEDREKRKMYQGLLGEKRAKEKKEAWIRELEARDREDEEERKKKALRRAAMKDREGVAKSFVAKSPDGENSSPVPKERKATAKSQEGENSSPLEREELRALVGGSSLYRIAMARWDGRDVD